MSEDDLPRPVRVLAGLAGLGTVVWATWCTVIAFVGGTMPIVGWQSEGGVGPGLVWLFLVEPIAVTVVMWIVGAIGAVIAMAWQPRRR